MKLKKRIAAMGAAMAMAVSMMSIGASAYSESFSLSKTKPSFSKTVTVNSTTLTMYLDYFSCVGSSTASVTLYSTASSTCRKTWSSAPQSYSETLPVSALGSTVTVGAYINNYSLATHVNVSVRFTC